MLYNFEIVDSTNEYLKKNKNKYNEYDGIVAKIQTKGKARSGNYWYSNEGMALFTFYIENNMEIKEASKIPIIAGYAVIKALKQIENQDYMFKWTNDIYLNDKKMGGILVENYNNALFIGIGLNINNKVVEEISNIAISLKEKTNKKYVINNIVEKIIDEFKNARKLKFENIIEYLNSINYLKDKNISIRIGNDMVRGKVLNISFDGGLNLLVDDEIRNYKIGEVMKKRILYNIGNYNEEELEKMKEGNDIILYYILDEINSIDINEAKKISKEKSLKLYILENGIKLKEIVEKYNINT